MSKLIVISHRSNINGRDLNRENNPKYIKELLSQNIPCEIDLRTRDNKLYLGHDTIQYKIDLNFLVENRKNLFIHAKDIKTLYFLTETCYDLHYFSHMHFDDFVLTSKKLIWTANKKFISNKSILVDLSNHPNYNIKTFGLCCDYLK